MSYSVNLIHPISTLSLDFSIKPSQYDDYFINIFSENLPYHLKHTSWNNQDTTFYFSDVPNNQYSGYFKNPELFLKDYSSLKNNGVSFSGITEHSNFKSMLPFLKKIQPDLSIHQYFVLSLISQNFNDCSFSLDKNSILIQPSENFIKDLGIQQLLFLQQLFSQEASDFFNSFFHTSIHKNILEGNFTLSYQAENQINVLSLTLSENSLQINNFNSNLNQFTIQNTYHLDKIKEENFLGIPSSFIKIIQFVNLENKLSSSPTRSKLKI